VRYGCIVFSYYLISKKKILIMCDVLQQVLRGLFVRGMNAAFGLHGPTAVPLVQARSCL